MHITFDQTSNKKLINIIIIITLFDILEIMFEALCMCPDKLDEI